MGPYPGCLPQIITYFQARAETRKSRRSLAYWKEKASSYMCVYKYQWRLSLTYRSEREV